MRLVENDSSSQLSDVISRNSSSSAVVCVVLTSTVVVVNHFVVWSSMADWITVMKVVVETDSATVSEVVVVLYSSNANSITVS